jgi:hypothetical protein
MKRKTILSISVVALLFVVYKPANVTASPIGTVFTYQGRLIDNKKAADGLYDFQFKLFDANSGGNKLGADVNKTEVNVIDGYFTVELDFGSVFDGNERWLDIGVRPGDQNDPNVYTLLSPRQKVTPTPYALYAKTAGNLGSDSVMPAGVILPYGGTSAPTGWLLCDGSAVSRTSYATLFAVIGTSFGIGDGSTTFNLPNFTNRFPYGASTGSAPGNAHVGSAGVGIPITGNDNALHQYHTGTAGGIGGGNLTGTTDGMAPYLAVYFVIKY